MSDSLIRTIQQLSRDEAIEAARFLGRSVVEDEPAPHRDTTLAPIAEEPYGHLPDVESLARLLLLVAASTPGGADEVERAIAGVGRKQLVLGGAEIVALAALAVVALRILVTGGRGRSARRVKLYDTDGRPRVEIEEIDEPISISADLAQILHPVLGRDAPSPPAGGPGS